MSKFFKRSVFCEECGKDCNEKIIEIYSPNDPSFALFVCKDCEDKVLNRLNRK